MFLAKDTPWAQPPTLDVHKLKAQDIPASTFTRRRAVRDFACYSGPLDGLFGCYFSPSACYFWFPWMPASGPLDATSGPWILFLVRQVILKTKSILGRTEITSKDTAGRTKITSTGTLGRSKVTSRNTPQGPKITPIITWPLLKFLRVSTSSAGKP